MQQDMLFHHPNTAGEGGMSQEQGLKFGDLSIKSSKVGGRGVVPKLSLERCQTCQEQGLECLYP
jgi:hypothetical protein